jgi:hypothetical protein
MQLPHWLMIVGAFLVLGGLVGLVLTRSKEDADPISPPNDDQAAEPELPGPRVEGDGRPERRRVDWGDGPRLHHRTRS